MNAIEEVHVMCIALATATETVESHDEREWLGVVMASGHPEKCVPPLLADGHIGMLISVTRGSVAVIRATARLRSLML